VRREYADRHAQIVESLERRFPSWLRLIPSAAGLHVSAGAVAGKRVEILRAAQRAQQRGVRVGVLSDYYLGAPARAGLVIGYGAILASRIDEGMKRLAASFA
jgi:GntR family transcriptional regulator/MocR family aminotransferase